jgi:hypothetical protein
MSAAAVEGGRYQHGQETWMEFGNVPPDDPTNTVAAGLAAVRARESALVPY